MMLSSNFNICILAVNKSSSINKLFLTSRCNVGIPSWVHFIPEISIILSKYTVQAAIKDLLNREIKKGTGIYPLLVTI